MPISPTGFSNTASGRIHVPSFGNGGFVEVGPGEVQVKIGGAAEGCVVGWGWPGDGSDTIRMPVVEGFSTYASVSCESL